MTTKLVCPQHGGHTIESGERLTGNGTLSHLHHFCSALMGYDVVDNTNADDPAQRFTFIFDGPTIIKRVKIGENLPGYKAKLTHITSISVSS
ncbi:hypothetical protein CANDROIZ_440004 [Candidatus Roizmanbacteria bacterium]|nr:hypothetical protein CANDROIZ_440004 [Candidatus Roizmanbacteria bacterium]